MKGNSQRSFVQYSQLFDIELKLKMIFTDICIFQEGFNEIFGSVRFFLGAFLKIFKDAVIRNIGWDTVNNLFALIYSVCNKTKRWYFHVLIHLCENFYFKIFKVETFLNSFLNFHKKIVVRIKELFVGVLYLEIDDIWIQGRRRLSGDLVSQFSLQLEILHHSSS